jgi:hypothetical protein
MLILVKFQSRLVHGWWTGRSCRALPSSCWRWYCDSCQAGSLLRLPQRSNQAAVTGSDRRYGAGPSIPLRFLPEAQPGPHLNSVVRVTAAEPAQKVRPSEVLVVRTTLFRVTFPSHGPPAVSGSRGACAPARHMERDSDPPCRMPQHPAAPSLWPESLLSV